ncbi:hypothetical protein E4633_17170 [Geomonas terrae]|uniref:PEP-CTERM sorting domain-containing protein n=1 Tax=Geomonas terrae TaxID=2562681 RepID=A0A4S1CBJ8_9BACT|nr:hypothetical protein [Geomonas terrae]TGU70729.1 hypothetical protein E4633_17170 [Geomonas terrae]
MQIDYRRWKYMNFKRSMTAEIGAFTALFLTHLSTPVFAGPPGPPVITQIPATPVGNVEMTAATVVAVVAYGYWKSRK